MRNASLIFCSVLVVFASLFATVGPARAAYSSDGVEFYTAVSAGNFALDGNMLYIGGDFAEYGTAVAKFSTVDSDTGAVSKDWPHVNYTVTVVVSDGAGGWYIGGQFTKVANQTQAYLAHITAEGTLDTAFDPTVNGEVLTLALSQDGETLYFGGLFTTVNGQTRNYLASVATADGSVTTFDPNMSDEVNEILLSHDDSVLYAVGEFIEVNGGTTRNYAASFTTADAVVTAFDPDLSGEGEAIARNTNSSEIYIGGWFTTVNGGTSRGYLASFDSSDGTATSLNPNLNTAVFALLLNSDDSLVYATGPFFTTAGGATTRNYAAAFSTTTGLANGFNPNLSNAGHALAFNADQSEIYVVGTFSTVGGVSQLYFAGLNASTGAKLDIDPKLNNTMYGLAIDADGTIAVGGSFTYAEKAERQGFLQYDLSTKSVTSVTLAGDNAVNEFAFNSDKSVLYMGGAVEYDLTHSIGVLGFDPVTETQTDFSVLVDNEVLTVAVSGDDQTIYMAGDFSEAVGEARDYFAAVTADGTLLDLDLQLDAAVRSMVIDTDNSVLYLAGDFTSILSETRNHLAAIDLETETLLDFDPDVDDYIESIALSADTSTLYIGGGFTTVGAASRANFAAVSTSTGLVNSWDLDFDGNVQSVALDPSSNLLYVGGYFTSANGGVDMRLGFAAIDTTTGLLSDYTIDIENDQNAGETTVVNGIYPTADHLFVGGDFTRLGTATRYGMAWFSAVAAEEESDGDSGSSENSGSEVRSEGFSAPETPRCTDSQPMSAPQLFQATRTGNSVTLYLTPPGGSVSGYRVLYGALNMPGQYGASFAGGDSTGVVALQIHDLVSAQRYQFTVQAANGCTGGPWSNVLVVGAGKTSAVGYFPNGGQSLQALHSNNSTLPTQSKNSPADSEPLEQAQLQEVQDESSFELAPEPSIQPEGSSSVEAPKLSLWQKIVNWLRDVL